MGVIPGFEAQNNESSGESYFQDMMRNWADDANVRRRVREEIMPLCKTIRDRRKPLSDLWSSLLKVWTMEHDEQGYEGRSNLYIPAGRKVGETIVSQLVSGTFPGDDNFGVEPRQRDEAYAQRSSDLKEALKQRIENVARVRIYAERFYRQLAAFGNSPVKIYYDKKKIKGGSRRTYAKGQMFRPMLGDAEFTLYDGPVFKTINASNVYAWPENAEDPNDLEIVFEDLTATYADLMIKSAKGTYLESAVRSCLQESRGAEHDRAVSDRLGSQGFTSPTNVGEEGWRPIGITEIWTMFDPKAEKKHEEKNPVPFLITVSGSGEVLRVMRNPFWHQRWPILFGRMGTMVGRFYGTGYFEQIRQLNILLNDQTNQGVDAATYSLNPIFLSNPNLVMGTLKPVKPGVHWLVHDVNQAVKSITPDMSALNAMSVLSTQTQAWIADFAGAPPVLQGGSSPGRAFKTATGVGAAMQNARVPLQEVIRLCEAEVWEPMLYHFWCLDQQYAEDDFLSWIADSKDPKGYQVKRFSPKELAGDWHFKWLASTQTANQAVKGSQIVQLLQILGSPGIAQQLVQQGVRFNPVPLIKKLYQEVFGFRDVDDVIVQAALTPGGPPPPPQVPNVSGGSVDDAPGSEDVDTELAGSPEFQDTRATADALSQAAGDMGAFGVSGTSDLTG